MAAKNFRCQREKEKKVLSGLRFRSSLSLSPLLTLAGHIHTHTHTHTHTRENARRRSRKKQEEGRGVVDRDLHHSSSLIASRGRRQTLWPAGSNQHPSSLFIFYFFWGLCMMSVCWMDAVLRRQRLLSRLSIRTAPFLKRKKCEAFFAVCLGKTCFLGGVLAQMWSRRKRGHVSARPLGVEGSVFGKQ
ncbi:hypothetical protein LX32DRAFT_142253 [Colletotrichum zoysiae]|uniref:Transmembrane protein n=1 Tax=Colletotrichum zoysiae TaxID=1216348 RepID=A0AAD9LZ81_9PEZI|nr:hypothetical protein LX32DRAFT_142253 [Colletotrichum zoysiae]